MCIPQECEGEAASLGDKILLYVEEQAIVQLLIRQLAKTLCSRSGANVIQVNLCIEVVQLCHRIVCKCMSI